MVAGYSMAADTIRYMHYTGDSQWATTGNWSNQTTKLLMTNQLGTNDIARINKGSQGTPGALCQLFISTEVANVAVAVDEPGQLYMEGTESTPITLNAIGNSYNALGWNSRGTFTLTNYANFYATSSITIGRQGWWTNVTPIQVQSNKNVSCWASVGANCTLATTNNFIFNNQDQPYHVTNFGYSYFKA
ncbi:MAG: hypothetical protein FJ220_04450, partial [Kiritimatiellaceae bacterium]|nr:hypothetical protein [Kiritimatiellaceae bacterium]